MTNIFQRLNGPNKKPVRNVKFINKKRLERSIQVKKIGIKYNSHERNQEINYAR